MAVTVYRHPLLLLEAEELVYALVNGDAPEQLSRRGGSGLHPADAAALMALARESLDLEDADVQFLFRRYALPSYASGSHTCLARIAVFSFADWSLSGAEEASAALLDAWSWDRMVSERQIFSEIMPFGISITPQEEGKSIPFANGLTRLSIPLDFRDALLAFFSDYAGQAARLGELLLPVMTRLSNALEPFVRAAEPYLEQMERWVSASQPKDFLRDHMHLDTTSPLHPSWRRPFSWCRPRSSLIWTVIPFTCCWGWAAPCWKPRSPPSAAGAARRCGSWAVLSECRCWKP